MNKIKWFIFRKKNNNNLKSSEIHWKSLEKRNIEKFDEWTKPHAHPLRLSIHLKYYIFSLNSEQKKISDNINQYLINMQKGICGDAS